MKINFHASYREISQLLSVPKSVPSGVSEAADGFRKLLASIAPDTGQAAEKTVKSQESKASLLEAERFDGGPMARLRIPEPELIQPKLEPRITPGPVIEPVKESPEGVKTPALIEARRIPIEQNFTELKKSARVAFVGRELTGLASREGVDPALGMSIVQNESGFDTNAISRDGHRSKGLFQLLDTTGEQYRQKLGMTDTYDPFNPQQNLKIGMNYLRYLHEVFSSDTQLGENIRSVPAANSSSLEKLAVAAFNAGEGRVASAQQRAQQAGLDPAVYTDVESYLPETTQQYVARVMEGKEQFEDIF